MLRDVEIWLDNQLASVLAKWMKTEWVIEVKSSFVLQIQSLEDRDIFLQAKNRGNTILITKDADFNSLISELGPPPKIVKLNTGNLPNKILWNRYRVAFKEAIEILADTDAQIIYIE